MSINEVTLVKRARLNIAWYEVDPPDDARAALNARGFKVSSCSDSQLHDLSLVEGLAAVVFTQNPAKLAAVRDQLAQQATTLLDFGCIIVAVPARDQRPSLVHLLSGLDLPHVSTIDQVLPVPHLRIYDELPEWPEIGNFLLKNPPGTPPYRSLAIELWDEKGNPGPLDASSQILLKRAFEDCERVHLNPLSGGLSGAEVYVAYPTVRTPYNLGRRPQPLFVKIDGRANVINEYKNYMERVDPYIPFHLGPHLIGDRCFLGSTKGILVGEYVEESENFLEAAKAGRAERAVECLFDRTLYGWHRDARENTDAPTKYEEFPDQLPDDRESRAVQLGASTRIQELKTLLSSPVYQPMMVGPIHGDLNVQNVRVRGADAIVIDFLSHRRDGDIIYDAATLEASLFVDGFAQPREPGKLAALEEVRTALKSVWPIYNASCFSAVPPYPGPENPSKWFYDSVRQIRRCACRLEIRSGQYAAALARAFLRKACSTRPGSEHLQYCRAAAFVIAESVLLKTFGRPVAAPKAD